MKIAQKSRLFVLGTILAVTSVVGVLLFWGMAEIARQSKMRDLVSLGEKEAHLMRLGFSELDHLVTTLASTVEVLLGMNNELSSRANGDLGAAKSELEAVFRATIEERPWCSQLRLIGATDDNLELIRFDRDSTGIRHVPESELQKKGHRDYVIAASKLIGGETYFSPINLNREFGEIEQPHVPTLRVARQIRDDGDALQGYVVANVDVDAFLEFLMASDIDRFDIFVTDLAGNYLYGVEGDKRFASELGHGHTLQKDVPEAVEFLEGQSEYVTYQIGGLFQRDGELLHLRRVDTRTPGRDLHVGVRLSNSLAGKASQQLAFFVVIVAVVMMACGLLLTRIFSRNITQPLIKLSAATKRFAEGKSDLELPISRSDELGELARTFELMRRKVSDQQLSLSELNRNLASANKELEHFTHIASHELREPLNRIAALSELAKFECETGLESDSEELMHLLRTLSQQSKKASEQVTELRELSDLGSDHAVKAQCNIREIIENELKEFESSRGIRLEVSFDEMPLQGGYRNLISMLYRNLIENALNYGNKDELTLRFTYANEEGSDVFGVLNTGSWIEPEYHDKVFQALFRLEKSEKGGSFGMGLSICKKVVERHEGRIWVESKPSWTHFKFTFNKTDNR